MKLQIRFAYWIAQFEAIYGDIVTFYQELAIDNKEKLVFINNILTQLIKKEDENNNITNQQGSI